MQGPSKQQRCAATWNSHSSCMTGEGAGAWVKERPWTSSLLAQQVWQKRKESSRVIFIQADRAHSQLRERRLSLQGLAHSPFESWNTFFIYSPALHKNRCTVKGFIVLWNIWWLFPQLIIRPSFSQFSIISLNPSQMRPRYLHFTMEKWMYKNYLVMPSL